MERALGRQHAERRMVGGGTIVRAASRVCPNGTWDLHLVSWATPDTEAVTGGEWRVQLSPYVMKPASTGRVRLRSPDPRDPLDIELGCLSIRKSQALAAVVDGVELVRRVAETETLSRLLVAEARPGAEAATRDRVGAYVRDNVRGYFHPVGTCKMGPGEIRRGG
ncbi:MAG: GMC oxidoreductase [Solirubrobacteraceae bacterium]